MIIEATYGLFQDANFKANLSKTFYKVGLAKRDGGYIHYTGQDVIKRKGKGKAARTEIIANLAFDHTIARAEGDGGMAEFDREDDEDVKRRAMIWLTIGAMRRLRGTVVRISHISF